LFYCGREVLSGDIVISRREIMHKRFDADVQKGAMSLPKSELHPLYKAVRGYDFPETSEMRIVRPDMEAMSRLVKLHNVVGQMAHDTPDILQMPAVGRALEQQLIQFMLQCLASETLEASVRTVRHSATMKRFEELLEANSDRALYLTEICAAIGVAERTLRACCEEQLGMGPIRYLQLRRMHLVRRALLRADPSEATVTQIATDYGFWELGRFSVTYRVLFGELPSKTLLRPTEKAASKPNRPSSLVTNEAVSA
jgi:AraC-like DNA-binding protein